MAQKQKLGRPRAEGHAGDEPVEEEILAAARELFRTKGFSATSTREIASAAGLRQPTLFHYFKNKAAMMNAIALKAMEPEIEFLQKESKLSHPPDVALYRYVRFVVFNLNTNPNVIGSPTRFPELTKEDYPEFWRQYDLVRRTMQDLIKQGIKEGSFIEVDARIASAQLFALVEYTLDSKVSISRANDAADLAATLVLRALLRKNNQLEKLVQKSGSIRATESQHRSG